VWSKALKARGARRATETSPGTKSRKRWRNGRTSRGCQGRPDDRRARALETAYGCTGGRKLRRVKPQEWIWHETRPRRHGADESVKGSRKPEGAGDHGLESVITKAAARCGETLKGQRTSRKAVERKGRE
jgi:hypothetical protein